MANKKVVEKLEEITFKPSKETKAHYKAIEGMLHDLSYYIFKPNEQQKIDETEKVILDIIDKDKDVLKLYDKFGRDVISSAVSRYGMENLALYGLDIEEVALHQDNENRSLGMFCVYCQLEKAGLKAMHNPKLMEQKDNKGRDMGHIAAEVGFVTGIKEYFDLNKETPENLTEELLDEKQTKSRNINVLTMLDNRGLAPEDKKLGVIALSLFGTESFIGKGLVDIRTTQATLEKISEFNELGILAINEENYAKKVINDLNEYCAIEEAPSKNISGWDDVDEYGYSGYEMGI